MNQSRFEAELSEYEQSFLGFVSKHKLPAEWFAVPDHFAIKCASAENYAETCDVFYSLANEDGLWQLPLDGRFLASAELSAKVVLGGYEFGWAEIMQPRPGKEAKKGFVEHTEFLFTDFALAEAALMQRGVSYELQENPGHRWINIVIDSTGREIKLNDKLLADVVVWEREQGLLQKIGEMK